METLPLQCLAHAVPGRRGRPGVAPTATAKGVASPMSSPQEPLISAGKHECRESAAGRRGWLLAGLHVVLFAGLLAAAPGCVTHRHTVGRGPLGSEVYKTGVWYALYGFVPLSGYDSRQVVGAADDYRVVTRAGGLDVFLNIFIGPLGFFRRTVIVEK